jgi:hypothetical protein
VRTLDRDSAGIILATPRGLPGDSDFARRAKSACPAAGSGRLFFPDTIAVVRSGRQSLKARAPCYATPRLVTESAAPRPLERLEVGVLERR